VGDSKTPLIILSSSGLLNVGLNLVFVLGFNMTVDGVALATIASQYVSAILVVVVLVKRKSEPYSIKFSRLGIDGRILRRMLRIGIPSALSSCMYSIANIAIMSAINTFPPASVSAYSISSNIEGITYTAMNCFQHASMTFTGQNYGAKKNDRIKKVFIFSLIQVAFIGILVGQTEILLGEQLANLYINAEDPNKALVIAETQDLLKVMLSCYFLCGIMEVCSGALRGLGYSVIPLVNSLVFACAVRLIWIYLIFFPVESLDTMSELILAYPISWAITITAHIICILFIWRKEGIWNKRKKEPTVKAVGE
jgi:Na+-driven multidrug efflux pump